MGVGRVETGFDPDALKELIEGSGVRFRQLSISYVVDCPRCGKKDKLYFRKRDGQFICWVCAGDGFRGRPEYGLSEVLGVPVREIRAQLYGDKDVRATAFLDLKVRNWLSGDDEPDEDAFDLQEVQWPFDFYPIEHKFSRRGLAYLESRGIPLEVAKCYDLRYCPREQRVYFPIGSKGKLYGWQGRFVGQTEFRDEATGQTTRIPKVVTTKGIKKEQTLMFLDRLEGSDHAVLCEGPVDGLKVHGFGGNVVSMGKIVSKAQINLIRNSGVKRVYLALDPDAYSETMALTREFPDLEVYWVTPPKGYKDIGEMSISEVTELCGLAPRVNGSFVRGFINPESVPVNYRHG
jgi:rubredoxin